MFAEAAQPTVKESEIINLESFASMISESVIIEKLDLGRALVFRVRHPLRGDMVLVNTCGDQNAVVYM